MKRRYAIPLACVVVSVFGTAGIQALPVCKRAVTSYKTIRSRNKVSALTAARWAAWGQLHPDFVPHARPKYKYHRVEVVKMVDFDCQAMPHIQNEEVALLPVEPLTDALPAEDVSSLSEAASPAASLDQVASGETPRLPYVPPYTSAAPPTQTADVPEPGSLTLLLTGVAGIALLSSRRRKLPRIEPVQI